MKIGLSSRLLMKHLADRYPIGIASSTPLPSKVKDSGACLATVRGLIRRGWVEERRYGLFFATEKGIKAAKNL